MNSPDSKIGSMVSGMWFLRLRSRQLTSHWIRRCKGQRVSLQLALRMRKIANCQTSSRSIRTYHRTQTLRSPSNNPSKSSITTRGDSPHQAPLPPAQPCPPSSTLAIGYQLSSMLLLGRAPLESDLVRAHKCWTRRNRAYSAMRRARVCSTSTVQSCQVDKAPKWAKRSILAVVPYRTRWHKSKIQSSSRATKRALIFHCSSTHHKLVKHQMQIRLRCQIARWRN